MKKAEISTSTIIYITIGLLVLVLIIGGVITKINGGLGETAKEQCRVTNDADGDNIPDKIDPCPCDGVNGVAIGSDACFTCDEYKDCTPYTGK